MRTRLIGLIALLAIALVGVRLTSKLQSSPERWPDWSAVPYGLDGWSGKDATFDPVYGADASDTNLLRIYGRQGEIPVILYVGFYKDLAAILEAHTPEI